MDKQRLSLLVPNWPAPNNVLACTTLRGIASDDNPYSDFNLALHVDDAEENVMLNRFKLSESLAFTREPNWMQQVHGVACVDLSKTNEAIFIADAAFTVDKDQVCVVMTADCLPILVTDTQGRGVLAIHAGWRGLAAGVIKQSIEKYTQSLSIGYEECMVWLGPAISQKHFEVGVDVYQSVKEQMGSRLGTDEGIERAFIEHAGAHDKYFCDLYQLASLELQSLGVTDIYGGDQCTYAQHNEYYSYRRASHQSHTNCGRMASLIWMV